MSIFGISLSESSHLPVNPQSLQHQILISLQQPKTAPKERRHPILVALERGLNVSHSANIQPTAIESQI